MLIYIQRSNIDNFSAQAGHLISTKQCDWHSLRSITKPSGDALIQFDYKLTVKLNTFCAFLYLLIYMKSCSFDRCLLIVKFVEILTIQILSF